MSIKALQEYTYVSKYARYNNKKRRRETWEEAVDRVKEMHLRKYPQASEHIEWAFQKVKEKRVLGSQRALQFGGNPIEQKNARLYNCIASYCDRMRFFQECFWLLLCGCGTGFSVQKHHIAKLPDFHSHLTSGLLPARRRKVYLIPDSIEGWADALGILLATYMPHPEFPEWQGCEVEFDYSDIRPAGSILASGVGKAPGAEPLKRAMEMIRKLLDQLISQGQTRLKPINAYDIVMHASDAVLSGGVRRSATICLFSPDDEEMATAKTGNWYTDNPQRARSNNSALLVRDEMSREQFYELMKSVRQFGEPGFLFADSTEYIVNPCVEIGLYPVHWLTGKTGWQACNLCEINGRQIKTKEDFKIAARAGSIIGTLQAGYTKFDYLGSTSEEIIQREALLGVSVTGMMDNPDVIFDEETQREMAQLILDTNEWFAKIIGINPAARATCVKPAGCQRPDTMIVSDQGLLMLGEVGRVDGQTWQNHHLSVFAGETHEKSTKFFINGHDKTKKIKTLTGMELECTPNHRYKVLRGGELNWVRADQIVEGDLIPYVVGGYRNENSVSLSPLVDVHFNAKWFRSPDALTDDLCWLLGLYTGDGSNHKKGIRIHGNANHPADLDRATTIIRHYFGLESKIESDRRGGGRLTLVVNSSDFVRWLELNGLKKSKSCEVSIPLTVRRASPELVAAFVDGYWCADGGLHPTNKTRNWVTTSRLMAHQLVVVLRALGQDCSVREMPATATSKGTRMRYWVQEKKGRRGNCRKSPLRAEYARLDAAGLSNYLPDVVVGIEDSECLTLDIEVPNGNAYCANGYVSHNTTSCILGSASGIHPHHAKRYFRRSQGNKLETPLQYFKNRNPLAVEDSVWSANGTDEVVTFCVEIPDGARTKKDVGAIELLEHVKLTQQNWVKYGTRAEACVQPWLVHNVSNTINVRPDEWDTVQEYIYDNRQYFAGIAMLPTTGDLDYPQAPMCTIHDMDEIESLYGEGSRYAGALIEPVRQPFKGNLWKACEVACGFGEPASEPAKVVAVATLQKFAQDHFGGDVRKAGYCLKEVYNWNQWQLLTANYVDVDYSSMIEETDETKPMDTIACAGGACEVVFN